LTYNLQRYMKLSSFMIAKRRALRPVAGYLQLVGAT
jgi:hypothetical protein